MAIAKGVYEEAGNVAAEARVSHVAARAMAGLGHFEQARPEFEDNLAQTQANRKAKLAEQTKDRWTKQKPSDDGPQLSDRRPKCTAMSNPSSSLRWSSG